jgi:hypothetical protein
MYLIKRYANGRFYDTVEKKYTTRDRIAALVDAGEAVAIVETKTGRDITRQILTRYTPKRAPEAKEEKKKGSEPEAEKDEPAESLFALLFSMGEEVFHDIREIVASMRENFTCMPKDDVDRLLDSLKKRKEKDDTTKT